MNRPLPPENAVNVGGKGTDQDLRYWVWDLVDEKFKVMQSVDACEALAVDSVSLTPPDGVDVPSKGELIEMYAKGN